MDRELRKAGTGAALKHTLFIVVPLLVAFAVLPGVYQNHLLLFNFVIFLILAQGVNIIYGFTGYLPFGYVGFFGAGAYGFAILVMHYQAPAPLAVLVAGVVGVALEQSIRRGSYVLVLTAVDAIGKQQVKSEYPFRVGE